MYNDEDEKQFTRLTLENNDVKIVYELPSYDCNGEDMMHAIYTIMIGMTFLPRTIYNSMAEYLREYADDLFDVYDHQEPEKEDNDDTD